MSASSRGLVAAARTELAVGFAVASLLIGTVLFARRRKAGGATGQTALDLESTVPADGAPVTSIEMPASVAAVNAEEPSSTPPIDPAPGAVETTHRNRRHAWRRLVAIPLAIALLVSAALGQAVLPGVVGDGGPRTASDWATISGSRPGDGQVAAYAPSASPAAPTPSPAPTPTQTPAPTPTQTPSPTPTPAPTPTPHVVLSVTPPKAGSIALYSSGRTTKKVIAITIDDCFSESAVLADLAILQKYHVNATWFPIGHVVATYPDTFRKVAAAGYPFANHTYSHSDLTKKTYDWIVSDIERDNAVVSAIIGEPLLPIVRPMGGSWNQTALNAASAAGERVMALWDISDGDTAALPYRANVDHLVANAIQGGPGSVLLMHANLPYAQQALPRIIEYYQSKGYTFVTLGQMFGLGGPVPYP